MGFWEGYIVAKANANTPDSGGAGLSLLAVIIAAVVGILYGVWVVGSYIASLIQAHPLVAFVGVTVSAAYMVDTSPDTRDDLAGASAIWFFISAPIFLVVYNRWYTGSPETTQWWALIVIGVAAIVTVWSFLGFLKGLVRQRVTGRVPRGVRAAAVALIAWSVVAGLSNVSWPLPATTVGTVGIVGGTAVGVYGMLRESQSKPLDD